MEMRQQACFTLDPNAHAVNSRGSAAFGAVNPVLAQTRQAPCTMETVGMLTKNVHVQDVTFWAKPSIDSAWCLPDCKHQSSQQPLNSFEDSCRPSMDTASTRLLCCCGVSCNAAGSSPATTGCGVQGQRHAALPPPGQIQDFPAAGSWSSCHPHQLHVH